ncbi:winged helix-turn-helix transcriptional regulator [Nonomuraea fuscirosea]|uniref:winged helix-turn-helix transcriptional regulator n=1 Tax=Nonomuraea fuscirosea TaxID=1291556 RepID=UPI003420FB2E
MGRPITELDDTASDLCEQGRDLIRDVLERIGDKWSVVVIRQLGDTTRRFNELRRMSEPITQRMLSATLRALERDGLVARTVHDTNPPRVDYALTPRGLGLLQVVRSRRPGSHRGWEPTSPRRSCTGRESPGTSQSRRSMASRCDGTNEAIRGRP